MDYSISSFGEKAVRPSSLLIVEPNPYHGVILPGLTHYAQMLKYNVDLLVRSENAADNPFSRFDLGKMPDIYSGSAQEIKTALQSGKIKEYDYVLLSTNAFWEPGVYQNSYIRFLGFIPTPKYGTILLEHNLSHLDEDDSTLLFNTGRVATLYRFPYQGKTTKMVNPHFLGKFDHHKKHTVTEFITVGAVTAENRNHSLLISSAEKLVNSGVRNFHISVVGSGSLTIPHNLSRYISLLGKLDYPSLYKALENSHYYLPLLDPDARFHQRYLKGTTTGSLLLIFGTGKVPVLNSSFASFYGFNSDNAIIHDGNDLYAGMVQAIEQDDHGYMFMQKNINSYAESISIESLDNLKGILKQIQERGEDTIRKEDEQQVFLAKRRLLEETNSVRLEIKEIRRQLGIDDDSPLFRLKNAFVPGKNKTTVPPDEKQDRVEELQGLTAYLNRMKKLRKILFFMPRLISSADFIRYDMHRSETRHCLRSLDKSKKTVLVFGAIPYTFRFQRPQHLAEGLAEKGWTVAYAELTRSSFPSLSIKKIKNNIFNILVSVSGNPNVAMQLPSEKNREEIVRFLKQIPFAKKTAVKIDHPFWSFAAREFGLPSMYDCMDDHESFEAGNTGFAALEKELAAECSFVTASSRALEEKMKRYGATNVILLNNAGEYDHFSKALLNLPVPTDMKNIKGRIIGYYGAIAEWFDENIIIKLARTFPNDSIVLIGHVSHPTLKAKAQSCNNIHFLGEKPYKELPNYLRKFDVCLIPFVLNDLIKATNPVKIYEYFAAGKPVVSTDLPELQDFKDVMYLSKTAGEFISNVESALKEVDKTIREKRRKIASDNTWEKRGEVLDHAVSSLFSSS